MRVRYDSHIRIQISKPKQVQGSVGLREEAVDSFSHSLQLLADTLGEVMRFLKKEPAIYSQGTNHLFTSHLFTKEPAIYSPWLREEAVASFSHSLQLLTHTLGEVIVAPTKPAP